MDYKDPLRTRAMSALVNMGSRRSAIQIHVYLYITVTLRNRT